MRDIVTKEVVKKGAHIGWKVYVRGRKFPRKHPNDCYTNMTEENAIKKAIAEYKGEKQESLGEKT